MAGKFLQKWNIFQKKYFIKVTIMSIWAIGLFLITYFISYTDSYFELIHQGILPDNRIWTLYTGLGLLIISFMVLLLSSEEESYKKRRNYIKSLPELKSNLSSLFQTGEFEAARKLIHENKEKIRENAFEELEFFDKFLKVIEKNQFFGSRLENAAQMLKLGNYPMLHWELGRLTNYVKMEQTILSREKMEEYSQLYQIGQDLYHKGLR